VRRPTLGVRAPRAARGFSARGRVLPEAPASRRPPPPEALSYGPPWAHNLGGYQDRLLGGPLGLPDLRCTAHASVKNKDYGGEVLG
jgi:hypothetical protein